MAKLTVALSTETYDTAKVKHDHAARKRINAFKNDLQKHRAEISKLRGSDAPKYMVQAGLEKERAKIAALQGKIEALLATLHYPKLTDKALERLRKA